MAFWAEADLVVESLCREDSLLRETTYSLVILVRRQRRRRKPDKYAHKLLLLGVAVDASRSSATAVLSCQAWNPQRLEADRKPGHGPERARVGRRLLSRGGDSLAWSVLALLIGDA